MVLAFTVSSFFAVISWFAADYFIGTVQERVRVENERARIMQKERQRQASVSEEVWSKIQRAEALSEWQRILAEDVRRLSGEEKQKAEFLVKSKIFEAYFWQAERLLGNARTLLIHDEHHPTAAQYLKRAKEIYKKMDDFAPALVEQPQDRLWSARINYLKGKYYFRSLIFVEDPKNEKAKVLDLVTRSATRLSKVFEFLPKDYHTSLAIEVLQKQAKNMLSPQSGNDKTKLRLELLPEPQKEISPQFGIGGTEGKH